jgi:hypothetical protein
VKKTINQKSKEVRRNKERLEKDLASVNQTNSCVELEISVLLQKLQDGHLSCVEVLRAYQAKVYFLFSSKLVNTKFILTNVSCLDSGSGNNN